MKTTKLFTSIASAGLILLAACGGGERRRIARWW